MGIDIDFLAVGNESSGGDAIAVRWGNLHGTRDQQYVVVVDGGYQESGEKLVDHIREHFGTERVDLVISTHPDQDHTSGLKVVLEQLEVGELWMHRPWLHSTEMSMLRAKAFESAKLSARIELSLQTASDLEAIALAKRINIVEPFAGQTTPDNVLVVLSPSENYYTSLVSEILDGKSVTHSITAGLEQLFKKAVAKVRETLTDEALGEDGVVSPRNNSSVICYIVAGTHRALLTGDAGIPALEQAASLLEGAGFTPGSLDFVQIPHHGSKRNVGPSVLNRLLGQKGAPTARGTAFVSAPAKNPDGKHPADIVVNAFIRRGYPVHVTEGQPIRHYRDSPPRSSYTSHQPRPFIEWVEQEA